MTTTAAAHIITTDAAALGDPEVIVMTRDDEGLGADEIARYTLHDGVDPVELLADHDWRVTGDPTDVERGYWIVDVERA
ncbi:hypothetical protein ACFQE5_22430 [Pseudonocardia hispaniensis]|uniref:DUF2249 domain-containing protein n=1 Tax=Pseudonocardia hispaniensis TaxID=904933 RepID=A0ABW1J8Q1_9PSEU